MTKDNHIPQGYKPSPLGLIPEDWEVKYLGDLLAKLANGLTYDVSVTQGHPVSRIETISNGVINYSKVGHIADTEGLEAYKMHNGDILYSHINSLAHIGKVAYYDEKHELYHGMNLLLLRANNNIESRYLYLYLLTSQSKHTAQLIAKPAVNQASISTEDVRKIKIAVPPLTEQQRIVSVLSLWDTAIEKQTALIEQLTLRKRGLMHQLLTGKKRLKGFGGEWKEVRLGEIGKFVGGCAFNEQEQGGQTGIPFYKVSDMNLPGNESKMNIANNYVTHEQIERLGYIVIENEAIIFAKVGAAIALERKRYAKNFIIDNNMLAYLPNNNVWYMKYWFDSISLSKYIQVGALPSYNASDLSIIKLKMPSLKEQNAIASVLVNADKEIEIQKQKLAAMQAQKKGLMQVLLTGKRRINI